MSELRDPVLRLRLSSSSGNVLVRAVPGAALQVHSRIEGRDESVAGEVTLKTRPSDRIEVTCPEGTDLFIGTSSGKVEVQGRAGSVVTTTGSGSVTVDRALSADVRTSSGNVTVGQVAGRLRVQGKSGRIRVGIAGSVEAAVVSGAIDLGAVSGPVRVRSVSGNCGINCDGQHDVRVETISGSVTVRLPGGVRPRALVQGANPRSGFAPGDDCEVAVRTLSGRVELVPV